jgi:hypothetical protein
MRILGIVLLIVASGLALAQTPSWLSVDRSTIELGDSCTLRWSSSSSGAFLSGVGVVASSGSVVVRPEATTTYVLLSRAGKQMAYSSVQVTVKGSKGDASNFPPIEDFRGTGVSSTQRAADYFKFLGLVQKELQDRDGFAVRGDFLPGRPWVALYTDWKTRSDLRLPSDAGIRQRRIAYWVHVDEAKEGETVHFEIKALVEYQRLSESAWHPESNSEVAKAIAQELRQALEQAKL